MNLAFKEPEYLDPFARCDRRGAVAAVRNRRHLRAHRGVRGCRQRPRRIHLAPARAGNGSFKVSTGDEPPAIGEIGIPQEFPALPRLRMLPQRRRSRGAGRRRELRGRWRLDGGFIRRRSRADARGLLSGLSAGREPRRGAGRRSQVRCRQRLLPPRAVARPRSAAVVPHARIRLRRHARADRRFPPPLDGARGRPRRPIGFAVSPGRGERCVLRPRRQADGDEPDRAGVEIRIAGSAALGGRSHRVHELQLSPRPFRHDLESCAIRPVRSCTPAASPSAWIAWRWRCSPRTGSTCRIGRRRPARR